LSVKSRDDVFVEFVPTKLVDWKIKVTIPRLNSPCDEWFRLDASGLEEILLSMVQGVPVEALKWADEVFLKEVKKITSLRMPGWEPHVLVSKEDNFHVVN